MKTPNPIIDMSKVARVKTKQSPTMGVDYQITVTPTIMYHPSSKKYVLMGYGTDDVFVISLHDDPAVATIFPKNDSITGLEWITRHLRLEDDGDYLEGVILCPVKITVDLPTESRVGEICKTSP